MHLTTQHSLVLSAFFQLAQEDQVVTRPRLCHFTELSPEQIRLALAELDRLGWVDADRLHLTLPGLAVAVSVHARVLRQRARARRALAA
jgi:hypothetical protein